MDIKKLEPLAQKARTLLLQTTRDRLVSIVDNPSHAERLNNPQAVKNLEQNVATYGREAVIDKIAYTWFNRFVALRLMDILDYNPTRVVSPLQTETQVEILAQAINNVFDSRLTSPKIQQTVEGLLSGSISSQNPQKAALSKLIVGACNAYSVIMPFLFQKIDDYTELLIPDDLVSDNSVLELIRTAVSDENVKEIGVEIIGWLYQYYNSERKDEVIGNVIATPDIPAATQLFTPDWIVRYLVDNTLGRAWIEKHPESDLKSELEYYIPSQQPTSSALPDDVFQLKLLDPCCGSGHMLVYAFDVFTKIYQELGYSNSEIPRLILENNLVGLEIDERASELAAFALIIKSAQLDRRFLTRTPVPQPDITTITKIDFSKSGVGITELCNRLADDNLSAEGIKILSHSFENGDAIGSLLQLWLTVGQLDNLQERLQEQRLDLFTQKLLDTFGLVIKQARLLVQQYPLVVTNPPYMGNAGMNAEVKAFVQQKYPDSKSDLFATFIERCLKFAIPSGYVGMVTMQSWMFLSTFEVLRKKIIEDNTIITMAHAGPHAFNSIGGEVVQTTIFTMTNKYIPDYRGAYIRLVEGKSEEEKNRLLKEAISSNP